MQLTGLSGVALAATLAVAGAAVVALYLLRQRRRRARVPHLALWEQLLADQRHSALWSQLKRWLSLLLALCIVALLAFALADPRARRTGPHRSLVILVDASASMLATDVVDGRMQAAKRLARELIAGLGPDDRALVAQLDREATPLCAMTDDRQALRAAVDQLSAGDLPADLEAGLGFARDALTGAPRAEIVLISDGGTTRGDAAGAPLDAGAYRELHVGTQGRPDNLGITAFAVRRYPLDKTQSEVLLQVRNYSDRSARARVTLEAGGRVLHHETFSLAARGQAQVVLRDIPGADRTLHARLTAEGPKDALPADDEAFARLPQRRRTRLAAISEGNRYLEAALLLDEYLRVTEVRPGEPLPAEGEVDVLLFDGVLPERPPARPALYLLPATETPGTSPLPSRGSLERPFVGKVQRDHPLTRFLSLSDVNIGSAQRVAPQPGDEVVVASEQGAPLIVTGERDGVPFVALTFDVRASDLPMRVAWPVFVLNALDFLAGEAGDYMSSQPTGSTLEVAVPAGLDRVQLEGPDGGTRSLAVWNGAVRFVPRRAGFYRVRAGDFEEVRAVHLSSAEEGALARRAAVPAATATAGAEAPAGAPHLRTWLWLLAAAVVLVTLEWLTFHRRWTV